MSPIPVGLFVFNEVEVLDFAGPFEVLSLAEHSDKTKVFKAHLIAESMDAIKARNGLKVVPDCTFQTAPEFQIVLVPGGYGAETHELKNPVVHEWLKKGFPNWSLLASICTGAFVLAEANFLDGLEATTHWMDLDQLERDYPQVRVKRNTKFVDTGKIVTSGGISAGINMALHIVKRFSSKEIALATAKRMEYDLPAGFLE